MRVCLSQQEQSAGLRLKNTLKIVTCSSSSKSSTKVDSVIKSWRHCMKRKRQTRSTSWLSQVSQHSPTLTSTGQHRCLQVVDTYLASCRRTLIAQVKVPKTHKIYCTRCSKMNLCNQLLRKRHNLLLKIFRLLMKKIGLQTQRAFRHRVVLLIRHLIRPVSRWTFKQKKPSSSRWLKSLVVLQLLLPPYLNLLI